MADEAQRSWRWTEESPGAVVLVLLVLAFSLLFPREACRGAVPVAQVERPTPSTSDSQSP